MAKGFLISVLHGPNLNLLGRREPERYGRVTLPEIDEGLARVAASHQASVECRQTNHEGALVEHIQEAGERAHGILINPAAFTHTSVAVRDALLAVDLPAVEVHLTNVYAREPFRRRSLIADVVVGRVMGFGARSYELGLTGLLCYLGEQAPESS